MNKKIIVFLIIIPCLLVLLQVFVPLLIPEGTILKFDNLNADRKSSYAPLMERKEPAAPAAKTPDNQVLLLNNLCAEYQCEFTQYGFVLGLSSMSGFYTQVERSPWGKVETCDALVVLSGTGSMANNLSALVDQGNTVNSKDDKGHLVLNLDFSSLTAQEINKIKSSTQAKPVNLTVLRTTPEERSVEACHSAVKILRVE